jgi:hypothetical protein
VVAQAVEEGDRTMALCWVKARHLHGVDVAEVGHTQPEAFIEVQASEIRNRPENAGLLQVLIDEGGDQYSLTRQEAVTQAKAELAVVLFDDRDA